MENNTFGYPENRPSLPDPVTGETKAVALT
jgi:hypothetical protein